MEDLNVSFNERIEKNQVKYKRCLAPCFGKSSQSFSSKWYKEFRWLHYNLDNNAAFCINCISTKIKGLKTIYNNREVSIVDGYRNWHHATGHFRMHRESHSYKNYVNQLSLP